MSKIRNRGLGAKDGVLPENPEWIVFTKSDADSRRWPTTTVSNPDAEGNVNFYDPLDIDHSASIKWRVQCGAGIAEILKFPDYQTKKYVIKSWPPGYQFYDHNKGSLNGNVRHDLYLIGSDSVAKFRSPQEFTPHAVWLLSDPTMDKANCSCKYCAKRPQREVTSELPASSQPRTGPPSSASGSRFPRRPRPRDQPLRIQAVIRRAPKPVKMPKGPSQFSAPERERDLLAVSHSSKRTPDSPKTIRWVRCGELVWIRLPKPIPVEKSPDPEKGLAFWPALVESIELSVKTISNGVGEEAEASSSRSGSVLGKRKHEEDDEECPWRVVHSTMVLVRLLIAKQKIRVEDTHLLPYQAYKPPQELIAAMKDVDIRVKTYEGLESSSDPESDAMERFSKFKPFPELDGAKRCFAEAAAPFTMAIQLASRMTLFWTPTDPWECRLIPANSPNAETSTISTQMIAGYAQTRFQGLWWGPERIWVGDLVRLKFGRHQFSPNGCDVIAHPGPSNHPIVGAAANGMDVDDSETQIVSEIDSTSSRGVFLRLDSIFLESAGAERPMAMLAGKIYELVDEDFKDEEPVDVILDHQTPVNLSASASQPSSSSSDTRVAPSSSLFQFPSTPIFQPFPPLLSSLSNTVEPPSNPPVPDVFSAEAGPSTSSAPQPETPPRSTGDLPASEPTPPRSTADVLSGPSPPYEYRLPAAPKGFKFRPIIPSTHEAVLSVLMLAGRFYPGILQHPLMRPAIVDALEGSQGQDSARLWALEGHVRGVQNAVDPTDWKPTRAAMARTASELAKTELFNFWKAKEGAIVIN